MHLNARSTVIIVKFLAS